MQAWFNFKGANLNIKWNMSCSFWKWFLSIDLKLVDGTGF
jgi:hypothetical protein